MANSREGKCYWFGGSSVGWSYCRDSCSELNSSMLCVQSWSQNSFISSHLAGANRDGVWRVWLGLSDIEDEGNFVWNIGCTSTYSVWNSGRPGEGGDCAVMNDKKRLLFGWSTTTCDIRHLCACERDIVKSEFIV